MYQTFKVFIFYFLVSLKAYKWLVCYLMRDSAEKLRSQKECGYAEFEAKNNSQVNKLCL